jgi:glycosyltransferase involved in cell wall biosynthesis
MLPNKTDKEELVFFSFVGSHYSRSSTILNFKSDKYVKSFRLLPTGVSRFTKALVKSRQEIRKAEALVVMSPCHVVTPFLKVISRKKVILDAGWSLTDGQLSRSRAVKDFLKIIRTYIIDIVAFHCADLIVVESQNQAIRTSRLFGVSKNKIQVNFTGIDEQLFKANLETSEKIVLLDKKLFSMNADLAVLFRGKINNESGIEFILEAAKILENQVAFILVCGKNDRVKNLPQNTLLLSNVTNDEMKAIYERSDIALGQLSTNPRLSYTIPHKAFEAGFFAMPYVTTDSVGIRELYSSNSAVLLTDNSGSNLASEILKLKDSKLRSEFSKNINTAYKAKASQEVLNARFDSLVNIL